MPDQALYIGIDVGTSGCRALAIDGGGEIQGTAAAPLPAPRQEEGHVMQTPELWWQGCQQALVHLFEQVAPTRVRALAVDGTSGTVLLADAHGDPLAPALMYNDRCPAQAERVAEIAPAASGAHGASAGLAKLLYLLERHGAEQARYCLNQADWIAARLSGRSGISDENNCLKLGYDPVRRQWPAWLQRLGVEAALLPRALAPGTPVGPVRGAITKAFGIPSGGRVVAGTTDSIAAFLATGASRVGEAVTSLGSTLVLKMVSDKPIFAPEYGVYSHRLGDVWLAGGASNTGGTVLRQYFSQETLDAMTPLLQPEQPTGLDYYPLPAPGERFPVSDAHLAPRLTPRPENDVVFFQGILEGIAAIEKQGYDRLRTLGAPALRSVRTAGGGARNPAWAAIRGRMLGVPLVEAVQHDAAYGAALLAQRGEVRR